MAVMAVMDHLNGKLLFQKIAVREKRPLFKWKMAVSEKMAPVLHIMDRFAKGNLWLFSSLLNLLED